jgi:tyrosine-protein phosphatase SIW14
MEAMQTFLRTAGIPGLSNFGTVDGGAGIYRSARPEAPLGYNSLKLRGIKSVLNLESFHDEQEDVMEAKMVAIRWPLIALESIGIDTYKAILAVVAASAKPLLVHCLQGHDRTGVVCAAYRLTHGWSLADAIEEMESYGFNPMWLALKESLKAFSAVTEKAAK